MKMKAKYLFNKYAEDYEKLFMNVDDYHISLTYLLSQIKSKKSVILDVGCGPGNLTKYIYSKIPRSKITGYDIAPKMIDLAKSNLPLCKFEVKDARNIIEFSGSLDLIISGFCLPYFTPQETEKFIEDCSTKLNYDGLIYLSLMEANENRVEQISNSSGNDFLETHFYSEQFIVDILLKNNLKKIKVFRVKTSAKYYENDLILIAKK